MLNILRRKENKGIIKRFIKRIVKKSLSTTRGGEIIFVKKSLMPMVINVNVVGKPDMNFFV